MFAFANMTSFRILTTNHKLNSPVLDPSPYAWLWMTLLETRSPNTYNLLPKTYL